MKDMLYGFYLLSSILLNVKSYPFHILGLLFMCVFLILILFPETDKYAYYEKEKQKHKKYLLCLMGALFLLFHKSD